MKSPARQGKNLVRLPVVICAFLAVIPLLSRAVEFERGEVYGSFDTTVSYGQLSRSSGVDRSIIGAGNDGGPLGGPTPAAPAGFLTGVIPGGVSGIAPSSNFDDGNTNFQDGSISRVLKFTSELDLTYKNMGAFVRFSGFKDFEFKGSLDRDAQLTDQAERLVADNINLLDAYAWMSFNIGKMPGEIRVGEQVISWGESTFIPNGINVVNPFDVSKLRVPGSQLKEALRPIGAVFASLGITDNISIEAFTSMTMKILNLNQWGPISVPRTLSVMEPTRFSWGLACYPIGAASICRPAPLIRTSWR